MTIVSCGRDESKPIPEQKPTTPQSTETQVDPYIDDRISIFEEFPEGLETTEIKEQKIAPKQEPTHHKSEKNKKEDSPTILMTTLISLLGTCIALGKKYLDKVD